MKMLKSIRFGYVALVAMVLAMLTSCTSGSPVEQIPDDADFAAVLNLQKVADELGVKITETDVKLPEEFEAFENDIPEELNDALVACHQAIEFNGIAVFGYIKTKEEPDFYVVAKLANENVLDAALTDELNLDKDSEEGFTIYSDGRGNDKVAILVKDGLVWLTIGKKEEAALKSVNKVIKRADEKRLVENSGFNSVLSENNVCNVLVNTTPFVKMIDKYGRYAVGSEASVAMSSILSQTKGYWLTYSADMSKTGFEFVTKFVQPNGDIFEPPYASEVSTDFLSYVPEDYMGVFALGLNSQAIEELVATMETLVETNVRGNEREIAKTAIEYLKNIEGTMSVSFGTDDIQKLLFGEDIRELDFVATIDMKSGKAEKTIDGIFEMLSPNDPSGEIIKKTGAGKLEFVIPDYGTIYVEAGDNIVVISNEEITKGNSNGALRSAVSGNDVVAYLGVESFAELSDDACKCGANAKFAYDGGVGTFTFEVTGTDDSFISAGTQFVLGADEAYRTYRKNHRKSHYGY